MNSYPIVRIGHSHGVDEVVGGRRFRRHWSCQTSSHAQTSRGWRLEVSGELLLRLTYLSSTLPQPGTTFCSLLISLLFSLILVFSTEPFWRATTTNGDPMRHRRSTAPSSPTRRSTDRRPEVASPLESPFKWPKDKCRWKRRELSKLPELGRGSPESPSRN